MIESWFPQNVSTFGGDIDWVFKLIFYIVGFWFVLSEGVLLYFIIRYRRRAGQASVFNRGNTRTELAWVLIPALIVLALDLGIDAAAGPVWDKVKGTPPPADINVRLDAKQFNWEFTYPGPDGKFDTADDLKLENELHVPVGKVVQIRLNSLDVIHSFFIPSLRLKQDVMPGRKIVAWFNATQPGTYEIACAELCGFGHYTMHGTLVVHSAQDYQHWLQEHWPTGGPRADAAAQSPARKAD